MTYIVSGRHFSAFFAVTSGTATQGTSLQVVMPKPFGTLLFPADIRHIGVASFLDDQFDVFRPDYFFDKMKKSELNRSGPHNYLDLLEPYGSDAVRYIHCASDTSDTNLESSTAFKFRCFTRRGDPPVFSAETIEYNRKGSFEGVEEIELAFDRVGDQVTQTVTLENHGQRQTIAQETYRRITQSISIGPTSM